MKNNIFIFVLLILILNFQNCGKKIATVTIVDEKTALEKQILGQFESINKDVYFMASVRGIDTAGNLLKKDIPESKRIAVNALQRMAFNADDLKFFKKNKIYGEGNNGFLKIIDENLNKLDEKKKKLAVEIFSQENADRKIIINRLIETNLNLKENDPESVGRIMASMKRDSAETGELIQLPDGKWKEKQ